MFFYISLLAFLALLVMCKCHTPYSSAAPLSHPISGIPLSRRRPTQCTHEAQVSTWPQPVHPSVHILQSSRSWFDIGHVRRRGQHQRRRLASWSRRARYARGARDHAARARQVRFSLSCMIGLMRSAYISFDQARLIRHNQILARNGIDPSGMCF